LLDLEPAQREKLKVKICFRERSNLR